MAVWQTFFSTAAEAAAALVGLIFVALSVNIAQILKYSHLPARAAAAMGALMLILVASLAVLAPQPIQWLGGEVLAFAAMALALQVESARSSRRAHATFHRPTHESSRLREPVIAVVAAQAQIVPFIVGGVMLAVGWPAGLGWLAGGSISVFILAVVNAWVLLVEILR
jgi:modulator of FtsH protease